MCGHDLRIQKKRRQRVSWIDALLVLAVLAVLVVWWRIASSPRPQDATNGDVAAILPTNIPMLTPTAPVTVTVAAETVIPLTPTPIPTAAANGVIRHRVREGETLLAIASQYNVTVEEIQSANNMTDVLIRAGDELIIPVQRSAEQGSSGAGTVQSRFEYTVQAGDTIVSIAARFGSTVEEILIVNSLTNNDFIRPGDVLLIPVPEVPAEVLASTEPTPVPEGVTPPPLSTATGPVYAEPRLIGPPNEATVALTEAALLRWISVDVLADNEWYVLLVYPISGSARSVPSIWTKATSFRLEIDLAPAAGETATYAWQVSVVRVKPGVNNQYALEAASLTSELRSFTWR